MAILAIVSACTDFQELEIPNSVTSIAESARIGLLCARCAVESPAAVNPAMKNLKL